MSPGITGTGVGCMTAYGIPSVVLKQRNYTFLPGVGYFCVNALVSVAYPCFINGQGRPVFLFGYAPEVALPPNMPIPREIGAASQHTTAIDDVQDSSPTKRKITAWGIFGEAFEDDDPQPLGEALGEVPDENSEWSETSEDDEDNEA